MELFQQVRVVQVVKSGRESLLGMTGTIRGVVTYAGDKLAWVEMDTKLPEGMELHGPLDARHRWVLVDPIEVEAL